MLSSHLGSANAREILKQRIKFRNAHFMLGISYIGSLIRVYTFGKILP